MFCVSSINFGFFLLFISLTLWPAAEGGRRRRRREPQTSCEKEEGTERLKRWTPRLLSPFSPDAEEVEGPTLLLLPPLRAEQHVFPPDHLVACSHPGCPIHVSSIPQLHPSQARRLPNLTLHHPSSRLLPVCSLNYQMNPLRRLCAFSCFSSFILSFHAFFIFTLSSKPLLSKSLST